MAAIAFSVLPSPALLKNDVECFRIGVSRGGQALDVKVCPGGYPGIVFQQTKFGRSAIASITTRSFEAKDIPVFFLHGQGAEPSIMHFKPVPYTSIQVILKPQGLYTIFGLDASAVRMGYLLPPEFGGKKLYTRLRAAESDAERVTLLGNFLIAQLRRTNSRDVLVEKSLELIDKHIASITVKELLEKLYISERQFQKRFARVVGMQPQQYIRVKRVNEALRLMGTGRHERLSDVAYALNFYDQSHFIREIKALSWVTPKSITQKVSDFHQDLGGASYL